MFEKIFGKGAQQTVLEYLIENRNELTYLSGIAQATDLSHSSVARVLEPLLELGVVKENKLGKQVRTFKLNEENKKTKLIIDFYEKFKKLK